MSLKRAVDTPLLYADDSLSLDDRSERTIGEQDQSAGLLIPEEDKAQRDITIGDLQKFLQKDVLKKRHYKILPSYVLFLIVLLVQVSIELLDSESAITYIRDAGSRLEFGALNPAALTNDEGEDDATESPFSQIDSFSSYWEWLEAAVNQAWPVGTLVQDKASWGPNMAWSGPKDQPVDESKVSIPIGALVLRQFRVKPASCEYTEQRRMVNDTEVVETTCFGQYSRSQVSTEPYPSGNPLYLSNIDKPQGQYVNSIPIYGILENYITPEYAFTELLFVDQAHHPNTTSHLNKLKTSGWIDEATRAVALEAITYNQADSNFVFLSLLVERTTTDNFVPTFKSIPFHHLAFFDFERYVVFCCDIFIALYVLCDFSFLIFRLKFDKELLGPTAGFGLWGVFQCVMLYHFCLTYYYRIILWYQSWIIDDSYYSDDHTREYFDRESTFLDIQTRTEHSQALLAWHRLAQYAYYFDEWKTLCAGCVVFSTLRIFSFIQYNEGLNILTETIKTAIGDLFGVILLACIVVVGFGWTATFLYGDFIEDFRSFQLSVGSLTRTLVSGEVPQFDEMLIFYGWQTRVLVIVYYCLASLILLNMVLGIITGAFSSVQDASQHQDRWNFKEWCEGVIDSIKFKVAGGTRPCRPVLTKEILKELDRQDKMEKNPLSRHSGTESVTTSVKSSTVHKDALIFSPHLHQVPDEDDDDDGQSDDGRKNLYIRNCIHAVKALHIDTKTPRPGDTSAPDIDTPMPKEDFLTFIIKKNRIPFTYEDIDEIYDKASREVSASNKSVNQGARWASGILQNLMQIQSQVKKVQSIRSNTSKVGTALEISNNIHEELEMSVASAQQGLGICDCCVDGSDVAGNPCSKCQPLAAVGSETESEASFAEHKKICLRQHCSQMKLSAAPIPDARVEMLRLQELISVNATETVGAMNHILSSSSNIRPHMHEVRKRLEDWKAILKQDIIRCTLQSDIKPDVDTSMQKKLTVQNTRPSGGGILASVSKYEFPKDEKLKKRSQSVRQQQQQQQQSSFRAKPASGADGKSKKKSDKVTRIADSTTDNMATTHPRSQTTSILKRSVGSPLHSPQ
eukprot:TRINITY_DN6648_c0_g1_i1.p1 TRINITY_DN6648_c0_g1~~TRINITY_DN6648_c0_g1_i1.p1  ORF type:complete len:1101 (+),score=187.61 TRINITY_DN6648_c0_g1_i1:64-3303(+)